MMDEWGRPRPSSSWGRTEEMPKPGTYRVRLIMPRGPWLPARVAWEQTCDPEGRVCDRWAPVLRILDWCWYRHELFEWLTSLHPITTAEFDLLCALPRPTDPLAPHNPGESPPVF